MRTIPDALAEEIAKQSAIEPEWYIDVWADKGPEATIRSRSQWIGTDDPMKGSDSGVSFDRQLGSVTLGDGATVAAAYTGPDDSTQSLIWSGQVSRNVKTTTRNDAHKSVGFTAISSKIVDSVIMRVSNVGNFAGSGFVRIVDSQGNLVGAAVTFALTSTLTNVTASGLAASIHRGRSYFFEYGFLVPSAQSMPDNAIAGLFGIPPAVNTLNMQIALYSPADLSWSIDLDPAKTGVQGVSIGGKEGFIASGVLTRQFDVGSLPVVDGSFSVNDIVPAGTSLVMVAWYTDNSARIADANNTLWTSFGAIVSGATLTQHRWWRIEFTLTSNAANDSTPEVAEVNIRFRPLPKTFGSSAKIERGIVSSGYPYPWTYPLSPSSSSRITRQTIAAVDTVSISAAKMSPKVAESITGRTTIKLAPEPEVEAMLNTSLRGADTRTRFGYSGIEETLTLDEGIVEDMAYSAGGGYTLYSMDDLRITDVEVPSAKAGNDWSAATDYTIGDVVVYGAASWDALANSGPGHGGAVTPGTNPAVWADNGTVWGDIVYDATTAPDTIAWHLAEVAEDLLTNRVNMRTERIDLDSIAVVKAARAGYTCERLVTKPTSAKEMLAEIAWLLEAQWIPRGRQLALVIEPSSTDFPVENITGFDIKKGLRFDRGWKDLRNQTLVFSGWTGDAEGKDYFANGVSVSDATSISDYHDIAVMESFEDRWNVPLSILETRATNYVNKFKDGRRTVSFTGYFRLIVLEPGDLVSFQSESMPPNEQGVINMMVLDAPIDFKSKTLKIKLMEV